MAGSEGWRALSLAAVGIAGALLGTAVQHVLSIDRERSRAFEEQQRAAYVSFLDALDKSRVAQAEAAAGDTVTARALQTQFELEGGAAFRRIAIYGHKRVVEAIAEWSRQSTTLPPCAPHWRADLEVWQLMRESSLPKGQEVSARDLGELAMFCKPPNSQ
jgi:hypothetical protein